VRQRQRQSERQREVRYKTHIATRILWKGIMRILEAEVKTKEGAIFSNLASVWMVSMRIRSPSSNDDSRILKMLWSFVVGVDIEGAAVVEEDGLEVTCIAD
jgi:hypothetical protein